ncbi:unnamed protein product [Periconia digitata]|uniref:Uncharacterized protein n=1 Tax=Periconia digitata TaxID=1303443 RepID=A0A9W4XE81_9PLEO|nr:unnamed protein product [Periconia digitata]
MLSPTYLTILLATLTTTTLAAPTISTNIKPPITPNPKPTTKPSTSPSSPPKNHPRGQGEAHYVRNWDEGGRKRYEYDFKGVSCNDIDIAVVTAGGIPGPAGMNFQCGWKGTREGFLQFDVSVVEGVAGAAVVSNGVGAATGQSCGDSGFCP